jgi:hypothetical protein
LLVDDKLMLAALWKINKLDYIPKYNLFIKKFNIFQADSQQIKIVKPGASIAASGFKRCNARKGSLDVMNSASTTGKDKEGRAQQRAREMIGNDIYGRSVSGVVIHLCQIDGVKVRTMTALTSQRGFWCTSLWATLWCLFWLPARNVVRRAIFSGI